MTNHDTSQDDRERNREHDHQASGYDGLDSRAFMRGAAASVAGASAMAALSDEAVAGHYLIADDDFVEGNLVTTDGEPGTIEHVGIRRTVLADTAEDERITIANDRIEPKWTLYTDGGVSEESAAVN